MGDEVILVCYIERLTGSTVLQENVISILRLVVQPEPSGVRVNEEMKDLHEIKIGRQCISGNTRLVIKLMPQLSVFIWVVVAVQRL